jgi:hypothetical protein
VAECCRFAEHVSSKLGFPLLKAHVSFSEQQDGKEYKRCKYTEENIALIERYPLSVVSSISFLHKKKPDYFEMVLRFHIKREPSLRGHMFDKLYLVSRRTEKRLLPLADKARMIAEALGEVAEINYLIADCMDEHKWVELFAMGMAMNKRTWFENAVAHSIGSSWKFHAMLPYLFYYNYFPYILPEMNEHLKEQFSDVSVSVKGGHTELVFPRCYDRLLDEYEQLPEWRTAYDILERWGIIVFPEQWKEMAKHDAGIDEAVTGKQ